MNMKHIGRDLSLKASVQSPGWTWAEAIIELFRNMVMLHIKLKGTTYSNMVASILPLNTPLTPGVGSKGQNIFSESIPVAYEIKRNGAP